MTATELQALYDHAKGTLMAKRRGVITDVSVRRQQFVAEHRAVLITYLKQKTELEDWHAVADAAMDLRELDARRND